MRRMRRRFGRRVFCTLATSASPTRRKDSGGTMAYDEMSPADKDRFICIYPAYLNNKKTIAEGRRIPVEKAVENPTSTEIQDVCAAVGLNVLVEKNKMYSREWNRDMQYRGRVRIQLKRDDGSLCFPQFPSLGNVICSRDDTQAENKDTEIRKW
ncbi:signal recognition particle 19 kDa protein isoform X2 [Ornithorhynchus anatinus]|uniref:signal recognition particle 19 kDa protein isoform X2 n=1 Tax=Ornithorhynchus anatinus TaxID=9258 RepID=UPI0010A7FC1A|nr:signal recognition particle 19 kDa protein isoform X2 [Ornithorhynchus anatinus]